MSIWILNLYLRGTPYKGSLDITASPPSARLCMSKYMYKVEKIECYNNFELIMLLLYI